jgi:hypothetical protein
MRGGLVSGMKRKKKERERHQNKLRRMRSNKKIIIIKKLKI